MQMIDSNILGPLYEFNKTYFQFNERNKPVGYKNLDLLHEKLQGVILRRLKSNVEEQLPERTVSTRFVQMHPEQISRYEEYNLAVASFCRLMKKRPLTENGGISCMILTTASAFTGPPPIPISFHNIWARTGRLKRLPRCLAN